MFTAEQAYKNYGQDEDLSAWAVLRLVLQEVRYRSYDFRFARIYEVRGLELHSRSTIGYEYTSLGSWVVERLTELKFKVDLLVDFDGKPYLFIYWGV